MKIYPVCVIGGGSAGTMAALRTVLNNDECLFFPGSPKNKKKSRALWVKKIENIPGHYQYSRGIEEPNNQTIKWILNSPFKHNLYLKKNLGVTCIRKEGELFHITDSENNLYIARFIILCTGVMDVQPKIQGSIDRIFDYANAQRADYCLMCDGHHVLNKKVCVIGHDNNAAWTAIILHERYKPQAIHILTNGEEDDFKSDTRQLIETYQIKIKKSPILSIIGKEKGFVLEGFNLEDSNLIEAEICFISLGMIVYNELAVQLGADLDERGFVKANDLGETSVKNLYVAGDLKANTKKQIYTAWDNAVNAANAINQKIRIDKRPILKV